LKDGAWLVVAALAAFPHAVPAATLGRLAVLSRLGEPLLAEIEIAAIRADERDSLAAEVAPPEVYRAVGVVPAPPAEALRAAVERVADGRYVVRVTSTEAVRQPLVDLLVVLSSTGGRLTRHYSFIVDPGADRAQQLAAPPPVEAPRPAEAPKSAATPKPAAPAAMYQVQRGDTLGGIARSKRADAVTVEQMMVAIYRANESAFAGDNMNRLLAGRELGIPAAGDAASVPADKARRLVDAHRAAFDEYRRSLGAAVAMAPGTADAPRRQSAGRVTAKAEPPPKPPAAGDRLRLTAPPAGTGALRDDPAASTRALDDNRQRIAALEQMLAKLREVLDLRTREVAELERQIGAKSAPAKGAK